MNATRREAIGTLFAAGGAFALPGCIAFGRRTAAEYDDALRDRCWMWGHDVGQLDRPGNHWGLKAEGTMDMPEACRKMGVENLNVIRWGNPPIEYRRKFAGLKRLTWAICGDQHEPHSAFKEMCEYDFALLDEMPNLVGFDMDDFFRPWDAPVTVRTPTGPRQSYASVFSYDELLALRRRMDAWRRPLDLRIVLYDGLLERGELMLPCAELATTATFWVWRGPDLMKLEDTFRKYRSFLPGKPTFLGVYLWDFGDKRPMKLEYLKHELDVGLGLWRRREIEGFVFLATSVCNKGLDTVDYVRGWLDAHGSETR